MTKIQNNNDSDGLHQVINLISIWKVFCFICIGTYYELCTSFYIHVCILQNNF